MQSNYKQNERFESSVNSEGIETARNEYGGESCLRAV